MHVMRKVQIYTTRWCPFCHAAKSLFEEKGVPYEEVDAQNPDMRLVMIQRAHGRRTVPQIFVGDEHLGGYREVVMLDGEGKLDPLIGN